MTTNNRDNNRKPANRGRVGGSSPGETVARDAASELARYRRLIDNSDDYMSAADEKGVLTAVNRKMIDGLGYPENEMLGRFALDLIAEPDRPKGREIIERAKTFGIAIDNVRLLRKDGGHISTYVCVTFDHERRVFEAVCRDISDRLRMEQELRSRTEELELQRERAIAAAQDKERLARVISHELRTPLTSIIGFTDMLLEDEDEPLTQRQRLQMERVAVSARHLLDLVNGLLDLSRIDASQSEVELGRVSLARLLDQVVSGLAPIARSRRLVVSCDVPDDIPEITTDKHKLAQIVVNLVSNAIKFTEQGSVKVVAAKNCRTVSISVQDTGVGIPPDDLPHVFKEFYRASGNGPRPQGTGLGLAIAQKLATLLGGEITVRSKEGVGSIFTLRLPITPDPSLEHILLAE